ncbi:orotate phosphoribosyltransferase [Legionella sp. km772]|uniref:orotate phosphoribosyltransferase n=1 Tax=Legionella sp. km772 TaxID=2498111 RepID=UPI000F8C9CB2|nr:orotate phosphoribosyltransferase [Legionella sp. km772]RUR04288.1 orotate phosphoribosyltransferase [Legionella sp. km772]
MNYTKSAFIKLALESKVLKFGEFTLKSGRISPYFFNAGLFYTGAALDQLGQFYAQTLIDNKVEMDHLFGPAYKGLPLATAAAIALNQSHKNITVTFNRKEIKDHGEGGQLIGAPLSGKTIIIDDVITAGTAFRESQSLIKMNGGQLTGVIIALDRCERGQTNQSALSEIANQGIKVYSIINFFDLIDYLKANKQEEELDKMQAYYELYGCKE